MREENILYEKTAFNLKSALNEKQNKTKEPKYSGMRIHTYNPGSREAHKGP